MNYLTQKPYPRTVEQGERRRTFCGPTAISCMLGITVNDVWRTFNKAYGRAHHLYKGGMHRSHVRLTLEALGYELIQIKAWKRYSYCKNKGIEPPPTFTQWQKTRSKDLRQHVLLIIAGNHYMVVWKNKVWDTGAPSGQRITQRRWMKSARMRRVFKIAIPKGAAMRGRAFREEGNVER